MPRETRRVQDLVRELRRLVGQPLDEIRVVRSPLRVCPLGAHIDHQLGKVTGLTLNAAVLLAFRTRSDGVVRLGSRDFDGVVEFALDDIGAPVPGEWGNYPRGAAWVMRETYGITTGIEGVLSGPLPIGGLSSSAAVDVAYLLALQSANELEVTPKESIRLAQRIENDYIGLNNGILDQSIILESRRGALTFLDTQSFEFEHVSAPPGTRYDIVVAFSGLSRALMGTDYNRRVAECGQAAAELYRLAGQTPPGDPRLRLVPVEVYQQHEARLPDPLRKRARHYFTEMDRVEAGVSAWRLGDLPAVGRLMRESGASSITNYECGSPHLIALYEMLNETPGIHGARFSGAGFRGSCVALADPDRRVQIAAVLANRYPALFPDVATAYSVHFCSSAGAAELMVCRA